MKNFIFKNKYQIIIVFFALANLLFAIYFLDSLQVNGDSKSYVNAMATLRGESPVYMIENAATGSWIHKTRILTSPLVLWLSIGASYFSGDYLSGLLLINIIFYFLTALVFYLLAKAIANSEKIALLSSLIFVFNYNFFYWGANYMVDITGWFFLILSSFFAVNFFGSKKKRDFALSVAAISVGVLCKEYAGLGLITLLMVIVFMDDERTQKVKNFFTAILTISILLAAYHLYVYLHYDFSYFSWYGFNVGKYGSASPGNLNFIKNLAKSLFALFWVAWPFAILGLKKIIGENKEIFRKLAVLMPASFAFLFWPAAIERVEFISLIVLSILTAWFFKNKNTVWAVLFIIIYVLSNYLHGYVWNFINKVSDFI